ncbi:MAG: hypothetical protein U0Y68_07055 [Blastocatellia bacterium]
MTLPLKAAAYDQYRLRLTGRLRDSTREWLSVAPFVAGQRREYSLFANGKTDYAIVVDAQASESERWAALELQRWLRK